MEKRRPTYDRGAIELSIGSVETLAITTLRLAGRHRARL
jgi:hypothetical protein